jgi:predicted NodU family carbamoyl transferase
VRILAFHSGPHGSAAAIFEDYDCIAAVQEERLTREKGSGGLPWLAIDEVLKIAGWCRLDIDAIATTRGLFPIGYARDNLGQELYYVLRRAFGEDLSERELAVLCQRRGAADMGMRQGFARRRDRFRGYGKRPLQHGRCRRDHCGQKSSHQGSRP